MESRNQEHKNTSRRTERIIRANAEGSCSARSLGQKHALGLESCIRYLN